MIFNQRLNSNSSLKVFKPSYISLTRLISPLPFHFLRATPKDAHSGCNQIAVRTTGGGENLAVIECQSAGGREWGAESAALQLETSAGPPSSHAVTDGTLPALHFLPELISARLSGSSTVRMKVSV